AEKVVEEIPCGPGVKIALGNLKGRLKTVKDVISSTNIFERGKEWADPAARFGILKSWQKTTSRICLTAGQTLETVNFVDKIVLGFFNKISFSLGEVPVLGTIGGPLFPLTLLKDALICVSAAMGIWDASNNLGRVKDDLNKAQARKTKWSVIQPDQIGIETLKEKYGQNSAQAELSESKAIRRNNYLKILSGEGIEVLGTAHKRIGDKGQEIKSLQSDILDATIRLEFAKTKEKIFEFNERIKTAKISLKTAESELENLKVNEFKFKQFSQFTNAIKDGRVDMVIRYKTLNNQIREDNKKIEIQKSWISIAVDVAKIVIITLALICMAIGISKLFWVGICISAIGFISESLGVTRTIYIEFAPKPKKELGAFSYA
ncbi:MAG TPA: hypothetical protein VIH61_05730, partial [Waddliaceae bacterium]